MSLPVLKLVSVSDRLVCGVAGVLQLRHITCYQFSDFSPVFDSVRKFIDFRERDIEKPSNYRINGP